MTLSLYLTVAGSSPQRHATLPTRQTVPSTTPYYEVLKSITLYYKVLFQYLPRCMRFIPEKQQTPRNFRLYHMAPVVAQELVYVPDCLFFDQVTVFRPRILDNINDWSFILEHRALLQSNLDFHKLGESQTGVFSYTVFLWAVPVAITLDLDVDSKSAFEKSDWLRTNVLLDCLQPGAKTYLDSPPEPVLMRELPKLALED